MKSQLNIGHWIMLFMMAVLPFAATFALPYPDERHYTDGAMQMLRDHDWLVPKTPETGTTNWLPRFHKPPLAYWVTAASFTAFGVNPLAARLPFLLACCGTILLTWRLARKLTGSETTAQLAAVILMAHPQFIFCATRSIPDALLVFSILLSAYGFLRCIVLSERTAGAFAMAYGGAALAVLSKGLLGAGIVAFAWAFAVAREKKISALKKLLHWPSLLLALAVAAAWFVGILHRYGSAAWQGFYGDQVTGNLHGRWFDPLWRAPVFALVLAINFLPWSLPALEIWARKKWTPATGGMLSGARNFIIAWAAVLIAGFALGTNVSPRYLLPITPLMAIVVAEILASAPAAQLIFSSRQLLKFLLGALVVLNFAAFVVNAQWDMTAAVLLVLGLFAAATLGLGVGTLRSGWFTPAEGAGLAMLLIFPLLFFIIQPIALPDPCQQMAATVRRLNLDPAKPILFAGERATPSMTSGLRLFLGGKFQIVRADKLDLVTAEKFSAVLTTDKEAEPLTARPFSLFPAATRVGAPPWREWWAILTERRLPPALEDHGVKYSLALHN